MGRRENRKSKTNKNKILIIVLIAVVLVVGIVCGIIFLGGNKNETTQTAVEPSEEAMKVVLKEIDIVDVNSKSRPYAVMINNNHAAWPQSGVQDAYLVYELIAEGGITRMMALYKDADTAKIGSVRSARHYFLDYAEENDAIFVHWGGSDLAYSRISSSGINDIDGMSAGGNTFFRDTSLNRAYEHTGFTNMKELKELAAEKGIDRDTNKDLLLNYSVNEVDLSKKENAIPANSVYIRYSDYHSTSYEYDEENKFYKRSMSGTPNTDLVTGEQYTAKNIITYQVYNYTISGDDKGRQEFNNVGTGKGYYITDGYAVPITWEKTSHSSQTVYKYENGEEINVNDGNTFIQIQPQGQTLTIE
ncbi:MAG: DUF3048 domain-containing protein [Clostridiales bacterium]|nr:DUF3048 domain-containing protein [Clostridiales bacterium]